MKKLFVRSLTLCLSLLLLISLMTGCAGNNADENKNNDGNPVIQEDPVTITIAGAWEDCKAIEAVGRKFTELYQNCTVQYEYLQNYDASLLKRMSGENAIDLFFTNNIQSDSELLPYAQELFSREDLDLSSTFDGLIENFALFGENTSDERQLYSIPLGAEMRGLFVNKTLLDSLSIAIPTDQASLLAACKTLKDNGYTPFHGNPGSFSQTLLYPWVCNTIANATDYQAAYDKVNNRSEDLGEMFNEQFEFLYSLVKNNYYDYKTAQTELNLFTDTTDNGIALDFFNIIKNGEVLEKANDVGQVAFLPQPISLKSTMDKVKDDYHSNIEYVFIPAPVGPNGGYVYMSPARGIAANKGSNNLDWSIKFLNFLFTPENNKLFSGIFNSIPNTEDAFSYISSLYDVPSSNISHLGQVTFDYGFYSIISGTLTDISKGNNPKYMQENADQSKSLYPLEYYITAFEKEIKGDGEQS